MENRIESEIKKEKFEDYALERIPQNRRRSGWSLSWLSMGIVSTLVQLDIGYYVSAVVGMRLAIVADVFVAIFGGTLGWAVSRVSFSERLSSTVTSRFYGFGSKGSLIASAIFAFMIIGFLALENALLYYGTVFAFGLTPTIYNEIIILGILTVVWILFTTYGVKIITRISSYLVAIFIVLLGYTIYVAVFKSGVTLTTIMSHGPLIPGLGSTTVRFLIALSALAGSAGALALVDADYARYAKSTKDLPIMAYLGSIMLDIVVMIAGSVIVYGGIGPAITYVISHGLATSSTASAYVSTMTSNNTGAFIFILASAVGFVLMYAAQIKAQVLNTYSGSLALSNFFDVTAKWKPGRVIMVVIANVIAIIMIAIGILGLIDAWLDVLGIITTSFAGVMIADFFIVRHKKIADHSKIEIVNIAGVLTIIIAATVSEYLEVTGIFLLGFLLALILSLILYPIFRILAFPESKMLGGKASLEQSMKEDE